MRNDLLPELSPYTESELQTLKERVLVFMQQQPGYSGKNFSVVWSPEDGGVYIQYGNNLQSGIAGFGATCESACNDFVWEWHSVGGEKHIKKYALAYKNI